MGQMLLIDCCSNSGLEFELSESANGRTKFRGKMQEAEAVNKNKRMYPWEVLDESVKILQEAVADRRLLGELDHPTDSIVHFANASHIITKLWWEANILMGEGEILNTPHGRVLKALTDDGVKWGMSSRGVGNGKVNEDGILVIGESYKLITFDAVADPSTFAAFQEKISKESVANHPVDMPKQTKSPKSDNSGIKNEDKRIDTINKEALIACLGGFVKSQTEQYKSRLG